ncbi:FabG Dehydrogenase with different specificities related to short-chain alcohol dehydrogenase [Pyrenophora tritici-repentis]|uniref:FabG, Dehydrogenase with different specificities (Related to short-chain alcohol dehydrogenase) n=2 Tax=Pyrenophora tritici-repentis TaxID=45151 RepID=A0A2W1DA41_9PLEO|nr:3-hydroxybutyrate dehydrogenase type 2 [Pyrenophora tritici-repentis Pt-1C-BFP]KAA8611912.1 Short chain dehydrogenase/oxidoreductase [Pyrenophora tritici-repentis]EDU47864.1 3-hydroxybutyrate dehydrogenase type 2 [Pyrenophora tritici-repentis Pt-1C-BFP]KAF7447189.1 Short chain dehydrogenase/oxidoreductase [Pyrenophora tritici-repentis]KAF7569534.1 FabG, Dehydrogenase with different specificities (related to short-chain alcohol dehydrogenase) [Pyrenophora tritici-repentis]KAG9382714.1 Short 
MTSFENKTVIVTGCSSGIGLQTTLVFLSHKARVFGIDIAPFTQTLDATQSTNFTFHQANLCGPNAAEDAIAACIAKYGPKIDVLANVAGVLDNLGSADTVEDQEWDRVLAINLTVPVRMMRAVLPSMKQHRAGSIVNVGSMASMSGATAGVAYTASKHGTVGATKNVAWRFQKEGIRCNAVIPGGVPTNIHNSMQADKIDQAAFQRWKILWDAVKDHTNEDEHVITTDDIAEGIVFLASDQARSISGTLLPIDNAWSAV